MVLLNREGLEKRDGLRRAGNRVKCRESMLFGLYIYNGRKLHKIETGRSPPISTAVWGRTCICHAILDVRWLISCSYTYFFDLYTEALTSFDIQGRDSSLFLPFERRISSGSAKWKCASLGGKRAVGFRQGLNTAQLQMEKRSTERERDRGTERQRDRETERDRH